MTTVALRALPASTVPAARPSFSMNSAVIGHSPTRPRMPPFPKYWRSFIEKPGFGIRDWRFDENRSRRIGLCTNPESPIPNPGFSVAHLLLAMLPALLRVEGERRDRARFEPLEPDFLVGLLAV